MKKTLTRILSAVMAAVTAIMMSTNTFAAEERITNSDVSVRQVDSEGYVLVSRDEVVDDESGFFIVDETFIKFEPTALLNNEESAPVKRSRSVYANSDISYGKLLFIMWVEGTFYWNGNTARVSGARRWVDKYETDPKVTEKSFKSDSDQGSNFLFGNKYAYIEFIVQTENGVHFTHDFRLWVDVNRKGDIHVDN